MTYRTKSVNVDAVQLGGSSIQEVIDFVLRNVSPANELKSVRFDSVVDGSAPTTVTFFMRDDATILIASDDDWIVRTSDGKVGIVKADVFAATYELVESR